MNHIDLQERIATLEQQESDKKRMLEEGFARLADNMKPANIARHSLQTIVSKTKSGFAKWFGRSK